MTFTKHVAGTGRTARTGLSLSTFLPEARKGEASRSLVLTGSVPTVAHSRQEQEFRRKLTSQDYCRQDGRSRIDEKRVLLWH